MYRDENINNADIIKSINNNDLDALNSRSSEDNIIDIYDFLSIYFMGTSNDIIKPFKVSLSNGNDRFLIDEKGLDEALDYYKKDKNVSKFSLSIYSEYEGNYTQTTRTHYEVEAKDIGSFEEEINEIRKAMSSLKQSFSSETKKSK